MRRSEQVAGGSPPLRNRGFSVEDAFNLSDFPIREPYVMSSASIHDKLSRVRKPRVHITYEVRPRAPRFSRNYRSSWVFWAISPANRPNLFDP